MICSDTTIGLLILRDTFNLTIDEIKDGNFLDKIRKDDQYINKFLKYNKTEIYAILFWCRDKFTQTEINKMFKGFISDDFININLKKN